MKTTIIESLVAWPTLAIIGGTHGNETCGVQLIEYLKKNLIIKRWKVILLYGNIRAIKQWVRQVDMNLNRAFLEDERLTDKQKDTYEYKRSREMMEVLKVCDYSLDIHSSPTTGSPPVVICEQNAFEIASYFPFAIRCSGFDDIEPGSTEYFMNSIGKTGLGVECGNHNDIKAFDRAKESTFAFLSCFDMVDYPKKKYDQKSYIASFNYLTKTTDFKIARFFADFEPIQNGQLIGVDGWDSVYAKNNGYILFARNRDEVGVEGFVEVM